MGIMVSIHCAVILVFASSMAIAENVGDHDSDKIRIILDTDANNELDDQHAIAYMLFSGDAFDVEGITVNRTFNGGPIEKHAEEAERIVRLCALYPQIKVYKGASGNYEEILPHIAEPEFDGSEAVNFIIERALARDNRKLILMPIGKLTNIALALKRNPSIAEKVRIVWLGTNYPEPGEYNFENDIPSLAPLIEADVPFEMAMVRYGKPSGTDAVRATLAEIKRFMPGKGPSIATPVPGRHGGKFSNFGDYSVELFEKFRGHPTERPLFDMAAVAIVKNSSWADRVVIGAPKFADGQWSDRPDNPRKVVIWENFDKEAIMRDFYERMEVPKRASPSTEGNDALLLWNNAETGYHSFRIPSIIVTTKGTVLAFCEGRGAHGDSGNIDLIMKRSMDNGRSWSGQTVVWNDGENTCGNPCPVVDERTGRIILLMTWNHGDDHGESIKAGTGKDTRRPYVSYSDDDGLTWSEPKDISKSAKNPAWGWYATGPGFGIQLESEKYKGRLIIPANHSYDTEDSEYQSDGGYGYGAHVLISDDGGQTWRMSEPIRPNCNESQVVELSDGSLMMNVRSYNRMHCRSYATSHDGGETWSKVQQALQLVEPTCQGSIIKFGKYQSKTMYLFSNPASVGIRAAMSVKASFDECTSWSNMKLVSGERAQYSCLTVLPNGNIGLLYEIGGSDWDDLGLRFISFPADELFKPRSLLDKDPYGYGFEPVLDD